MGGRVNWIAAQDINFYKASLPKYIFGYIQPIIDHRDDFIEYFFAHWKDEIIRIKIYILDKSKKYPGSHNV